MIVRLYSKPNCCLCDQAKAVVLTKEDGWQDWYYLTEFQGSADCLASVDRSARAAGFVTKDGALFRDFGKGYGETIRIIPERRSFMWERSQI